MGQFYQIRRNVLPFPVVSRPIMHSMKIHAGGKQIGVAAQPQCGQIATVAPSPETDAPGIDIAAALQVFSRGHNVLIFGSAASRAAWSLPKRPSVTNAAAIVDGKHDVAAIC